MCLVILYLLRLDSPGQTLRQVFNYMEFVWEIKKTAVGGQKVRQGRERGYRRVGVISSGGEGRWNQSLIPLENL